jgi:hypothetical protein
MQSIFYFDALFSLITHNHKLDNETLYSHFKISLQQCFKKNKILKPDDILREFDRIVNTKITDLKSFTLLTTINIKNIYQLPKKNGSRLYHKLSQHHSKKIPIIQTGAVGKP